MSKKVLILSTKNNLRSIIAHAVLTKHLKQIECFSAGIKPSSTVDANAKKILQREGLWNDVFSPHNIKDYIAENFDLVVIICENAMQKLPEFNNDTKMIYLEYEKIDSKNFSQYEQVLKEIKMELIPIIRLEL